MVSSAADIGPAGFLYIQEKRVDCLLFGIVTEVCSMEITEGMLGIVKLNELWM